MTLPPLPSTPGPSSPLSPIFHLPDPARVYIYIVFFRYTFGSAVKGCGTIVATLHYYRQTPVSVVKSFKVRYRLKNELSRRLILLYSCMNNFMVVGWLIKEEKEEELKRHFETFGIFGWCVGRWIVTFLGLCAFWSFVCVLIFFVLFLFYFLLRLRPNLIFWSVYWWWWRRQ